MNIFCFFAATTSFPVGVFLATVQVDVVGLGVGVGPRGGALPLPVGPLLTLRKVPELALGPGSPEGRVPQLDQRNLVRVGSPPQFRHRRR